MLSRFLTALAVLIVLVCAFIWGLPLALTLVPPGDDSLVGQFVSWWAFLYILALIAAYKFAHFLGLV